MKNERERALLEALMRVVGVSWIATLLVGIGIIVRGSATTFTGWCLIGIVATQIGYLYWPDRDRQDGSARR